MIETSIIMTHYAETEERVAIARQCILAVQPHRNEKTEFIIMFDGIFPYRDEFIKYADQWHERPNDASPGKSWNIGARMAKGNILCFITDDDLLYKGAVKGCVRLVKKYPQFIVTPLPPHRGRQGQVYPLVDGYFGNTRGDDQCIFMTRQMFEDIGPRDEVDPFTDGINYTNRRIAKGYHVLMTKKPLAKDIAPRRHSFTSQMERLGYKGYKKTNPIYSREELINFSYRGNYMKIMDGLKLQGKPVEIPDCNRDDLPAFFKKMGYKVGAEIGVHKGEFSEKFCREGLKIYAIDPWRMYKDYIHPRGQTRLDALYEHAKRVISPYPDCTVVRKTSMEAVEDFEDNSLDFVYIDGNPEFRYVAEDLCEWTKKVRRGGAVSGRLSWHVVSNVLRAYIESYNIPSWCLIGKSTPPPGEKRNKLVSWMFLKP